MKNTSRNSIIIAKILSFSAIVASYAGEERAFVDREGKVIMAELVSHPGAESGKVTIRKDGRQFVVNISIFRDEDQHHIKKWIKKTPPSIPYLLDVSATKTKEGKGRFAYKLKVKNAGKLPLSDFKIKYRVYMENSVGKTVHREHELDIAGPLEENRVAKTTTETFDPDRMILTKNNGITSSISSSSGTKKKGISSLLGVLVRVYDKHGRIIEDWRSPGNSFKAQWSSPKAETKAKKKPAVTIE